MRDVYILSAARTPIGKFGGGLSTVPATELGATAIRAAVERAGIAPERVDEVFMGQVIQAGAGQAPARQAALKAGLPESVSATTINKVCGSGLKAVMMGSAAIRAGDAAVSTMSTAISVPEQNPPHTPGSTWTSSRPTFAYRPPLSTWPPCTATAGLATGANANMTAAVSVAEAIARTMDRVIRCPPFGALPGRARSFSFTVNGQASHMTEESSAPAGGSIFARRSGHDRASPARLKPMRTTIGP